MQRLLMILLVLWTTTGLTYATDINIPILTYHNFEPVKTGIMTISTAKFEAQLQYIKDHGYTVIPLQDAVAYLQGKKKDLPAKPVVITADDGRITVYQYMLPLIRKYKVPVTLFIYPSMISRTNYALTWKQIETLKETGYFDIQSHTYYHPNFNEEQKALSPAAYKQLVQAQLLESKKVLQEKMDTPITLLAWPYGIYNPYLEQQAKKAGYRMAFSIDDRSASRHDSWMAIPRYMVSEKHSMATFVRMLNNEFK